MAHWKEVLNHIAADAEKHMDELRYRMNYAMGGPGPIKIITYRGYGTAERMYIRGRVLEDKHIPEADKNDNVWENLVNMYKRLESDEVPHAHLAVRFQGSEQLVTADEEGYFESWITPTKPLADKRLWHPVEVELLHPIPNAQRNYPVKTVGEVLVPPDTAKFVVVSDIDDTILRTDATHMLRMARNVFLGNATTRLPFPGVAALYRALFSGSSGVEMNPLFYVSSSPWNLYDLLSQFFNLQGIPIGPVLFLRDWGLTENEVLPLHSYKFKIDIIRQMIEFYPNLPFILIGDSGQEDPEIYADLVQQYPKRIQAVYIRNVSRDLKRPEMIRTLAKRLLNIGSALVLADDSVAIAKHAIEKKYIQAQALAAIQENKQKDEAPPDVLEKILGEPTKTETPAPTVKVNAKEVREGAIEQVIKETGSEETSKPPTVVVDDKSKKANK